MRPERHAPRRPPGRLMRRLAPLLALAVAGGCADALAPDRDALRSAEARWAIRGPDRYEYDYVETCFCGFRPRHVVVENGVVTSVRALEPSTAGDGDRPEGYTVEELFERVRAELARNPHDARTAFDPALGFPTEVWFDYREHVIDEEWGFRVSAFVALE